MYWFWRAAIAVAVGSAAAIVFLYVTPVYFWLHVTPRVLALGGLCILLPQVIAVAAYRRLSVPPRVPGCCAWCGCDLTGNTSGACPECGKPAPSRLPDAASALLSGLIRPDETAGGVRKAANAVSAGMVSAGAPFLLWLALVGGTVTAEDLFMTLGVMLMAALPSTVCVTAFALMVRPARCHNCHFLLRGTEANCPACGENLNVRRQWEKRESVPLRAAILLGCIAGLLVFALVPFLVDGVGVLVWGWGWVSPLGNLIGSERAVLGLMILVALVAAYFAGRLTFMRLRWRAVWKATSRCRNCDYDLTGNVSGVCPECGAAVAGAG